MRICWIQPTMKTPQMGRLWDVLGEDMPAVLAPGNTMEFRFMERSGNFTRSFYAEHLNSVHMLEAARQAEDEGFDGVFIGCWNDPLREAREILRIPVASVGEQAMLAALAMAKRFAVVTVSDKTAMAIEDDIAGYGLGTRAIMRPARAVQPQSDGNLLLGAVDDPFAGFIPRFEDVARGCVADGAEIILVGCGYYGPLLRRAGYTHISGTNVPVLDSTTVALKYLEAMMGIAAATGLVKSEHLQYRTPANSDLEPVRHSLALR